jgi:hypothetical protein
MSARFFRSWLCSMGVLVFAPCIGVYAQDQLDINVLKFMVSAPMEQVLSKLHNYGVLVCFEKRAVIRRFKLVAAKSLSAAV